MIITKLIGGLGNQMFQYAAGLFIAKKHKVLLKLDNNFLLDKSKRYYRHTHRDYALDIFNISSSIASNKEIREFVYPRTGNKYIYHLIRKIYKEKSVYKEQELNGVDGFYQIPSHAYMAGYWQDYQYFSEIENDLVIEFSFKKALQISHQLIANNIKARKSVCMVVRRGDYVGHPTLDVLDLSYYNKAFDVLSSIVSGLSVFVFSDDIAWCRENLSFGSADLCFVDQQYTGPKAEFYLQLMALCNHYIISNSTYAWWGAWFGKYPKKIVIAPKIWYKGQKE